MNRYAQGTTVSVEKSRAEIETILTKYGASAFGYQWDGTRAMIQFAARDRWIKFVLPLPDKADKQFLFTPKRRERVSPEMALKNWEQACHMRWMIRKDMAEVLDIERRSYLHPWSDEQFVTHLRQRNCIGWIAERDTFVVGFMVYQMLPTHLHLLNIAVDPEFRYEGIGRDLLQKLKSKLSQHRRRRITANVPETFLSAQKFFAACGFEAVSVLRNLYEESDEDSYRFVYRV